MVCQGDYLVSINSIFLKSQEYFSFAILFTSPKKMNCKSIFIMYSIKKLSHPPSDNPHENACTVRRAIVRYHMHETSSVSGMVGAQL